MPHIITSFYAFANIFSGISFYEGMIFFTPYPGSSAHHIVHYNTLITLHIIQIQMYANEMMHFHSRKNVKMKRTELHSLCIIIPLAECQHIQDLLLMQRDFPS